MQETINQSIIFKYYLVEVNTISAEISGNRGGKPEDNGTELECLHTLENISRLFYVSFMAFNRSSILFETIATYVPDRTVLLTTQGQYLKGRVTLTPIKELSTKAVMIFNKLMCIDDTFYQCKVIYMDINGIHDYTSSYISISVQVPPSKPDSISVVYKPADPLIFSFKHIEYSTSTTIITLTSTENEIISAFQSVKQNDKTEYSRIQTDDYDTTTSMSSEVDFSIVEGDSITVICDGEVGKPPANHIFQKLLFGQIVPLQSIFTAVSISEISENCPYYLTSNLTFQVTAEDNNAVIRCVVNSSIEEPDMYVETEPIEVYCKYILCNLIHGNSFLGRFCITSHTACYLDSRFELR
ncbi:Hypothetical predicted protein [Mytilus galloprovincialis]|uniref:Ig-like domain-containing protein n=1 Tax=Mytilus galloprovincialis TaxID=29158 RepID=A0A8B6CK94_MYTGA|nr:Hypothetical predicted protein [Mytilus galloprovincialis]